MGYQTRQGADYPGKDKSVNIAVIIADKYLGSYPSFYWKVYQEFALAVKRKNCMLLYEVLKDEDEKNFVIPLSVKEKTAEGIVVIGEISSEYFKNAYRSVPDADSICRLQQNRYQVDSVVSDNFYGMYIMTNYLIEHGHRDIAYVGTVLANNSIKDRYCGYYKALMENHIPVREDWIIDDRAPLGKMEIDRLSLPEEMPDGICMQLRSCSQ